MTVDFFSASYGHVELNEPEPGIYDPNDQPIQEQSNECDLGVSIVLVKSIRLPPEKCCAFPTGPSPSNENAEVATIVDVYVQPIV